MDKISGISKKDRMKLSREGLIVALIFFSALIIRLTFIFNFSGSPVSDAASYDQLGLAISEGRGYVNNNGTPHSFYPPFYPIFLSIIYTFFGHSYLAVRIVQSVIGALTCALIYLIGKRVRDRMLGIAAASISIFYFPFIKSSGLLLTELVFTFLLCLIVYYLFKVQEDAGLKNYIILGLLLGFALLTKPIMLLFQLFIAPIFFKKDHLLPIIKKYILVLLFFGISMLPWIIRNYAVYHKFMPTSTAGGLGFYSSYRPANEVFGVLAAQDDPVIIEADRINSPVLRNDFLTRKTLDFIINNPTKVLVLEFKKISYLWAPFDWEIVGNRWFNLIYAVMLPFFAIGFFLVIIKEFIKNYPILVPVIYFQIMTLIFYGSPRFRLPIEPYIFILSIVGIFESFKWIRKRNIAR